MGLPCFFYPKEDSYMRVCPQIMLTTPGAFAFGQALIRDASMSAFHSVWVDAGPYMDMVNKGDSHYFYVQTILRL